MITMVLIIQERIVSALALVTKNKDKEPNSPTILVRKVFEGPAFDFRLGKSAWTMT